MPEVAALRMRTAVLSASNLARSFLRYHLMVSALKERVAAIWAEVRPSPISRRISSSRSFKLGLAIASLVSSNCKFRLSQTQKHHPKGGKCRPESPKTAYFY